MNSNSHPHMRYVPSRQPTPVLMGSGPTFGTIYSPAILDRQTGKTHPRSDYTAIEIQDTVAWLNDRHAGYIARHGAVRQPRRDPRGDWMD
jgi:hypothetical protein